MDPGLRVVNVNDIEVEGSMWYLHCRVNNESNKSTVYRAAVKGSSNSISCTVYGLKQMNKILLFYSFCSLWVTNNGWKASAAHGEFEKHPWGRL